MLEQVLLLPAPRGVGGGARGAAARLSTSAASPPAISLGWRCCRPWGRSGRLIQSASHSRFSYQNQYNRVSGLKGWSPAQSWLLRTGGPGPERRLRLALERGNCVAEPRRASFMTCAVGQEYLREDGGLMLRLKAARLKSLSPAKCPGKCSLQARPDLALALPAAATLRRSRPKQALKAVMRVGVDVGVAVGQGDVKPASERRWGPDTRPASRHGAVQAAELGWVRALASSKLRTGHHRGRGRNMALMWAPRSQPSFLAAGQDACAETLGDWCPGARKVPGCLRAVRRGFEFFRAVSSARDLPLRVPA